MVNKNTIGTVDCACVIHGDVYDWIYVERLYNMIQRNLGQIRLHVYTEATRPVPDYMIKHALTEWPGVKGARKSWWYKMQLFDPLHFSGNLLYFDLDVVVCRDISWVTQLPTEKFWTIRDFAYLQIPAVSSINSSMMWWNVQKFSHVWTGFQQADLAQTLRQYRGDQDYLNQAIDHNHRRYFADHHLQSYRWQVADGGLNFETRQSHRPGTGANIDDQASVIVFHGHPKPHQVHDPEIVKLWTGSSG